MMFEHGDHDHGNEIVEDVPGSEEEDGHAWTEDFINQVPGFVALSILVVWVQNGLRTREVDFEFVCHVEDSRSMFQRLDLSLRSAFRASARPTEISPEQVMFAGVGCPGIIDTGASKTVIGRQKTEALLQSLPAEIQARVRWRRSSTIFRFGNNGILNSLGAMYIPFGHRWLKVEVVEGQTPFLLSIAFLRALRAEIHVAACELRIPGVREAVQLHCNSKGLFQLELADVLRVVANNRGPGTHEEVITLTQEHEVVEHGHRKDPPVVDRPKVVSPAAEGELRLKDNRSFSKRNGGLHSREESTSLSRRQPIGRGLDRRAASGETAGSADAGRVGFAEVSFGSPRGKILCDGGKSGSDLCALHEEQQEADLGVGSVVSELCQGQGDDEGGAISSIDSVAEEAVENSKGTERESREGLGDADRLGQDDGGAPDNATPRQEVYAVKHGEDDAGGARAREDPRLAGPDRRAAERAGQCPPKHLGQSGAGAAVRSEELGESDFSECTDPSSRHREHGRSSLSGHDHVSGELERLSQVIGEQLEELASLVQDSQQTRHAPRNKWTSLPEKSASRGKVDLMEVYCSPTSELTRAAQRAGMQVMRFSEKDGDLSTEEGRHKLWALIQDRQPEDIWMAPECGAWGNWSRFNMSRSLMTFDRIEKQREVQREHLRLCNEVYLHQVASGRHFHLEQPTGSEAMMQPETEDIRSGTFRTVFDMCEVGGLKVPRGNNYLRKRSVIYTTSRDLHECLDHRLCSGHHDHQHIAGNVKISGQTVSVSKFAARYTPRFATAIIRFLQRRQRARELPMILEEMSIPWQGVGKQEQVILAGEVLKRRRLQFKQAGQAERALETEGPSHAERIRQRRVSEETWQEIFRELGTMAPRVGTVTVEMSDPVAARIQWCLPEMHVRRIEVCRGTERFRVPPADVDTSDWTLRQTILMHRETGRIETLGKPERWKELSRARQVRKSSPARLCLTVFGKEIREDEPIRKRPRSAESRLEEPAQKRVDSGDAADLEERSESRSQELIPEPDVPGADGIPRSVARHGPAFRSLSSDEKAWLKRVHHRMGHPDPARLANFLKSTHGDSRIVAAALDMQCDACSESRKGFLSARPAAIHEDLGFNHTVGMDMVEWKNSQGTPFVFVHCVDEGTLFQMARECEGTSAAQLRAFEDMWISWAGPPKVLYLDPASEYASREWMARMQGMDIQVRMSAADSHWQLGRAEAHGGVLKAMMSRMDLEVPIRTQEEFRTALLQAVVAKNCLSRVKGYTPEQAVLGVARRLPASVTSTEEASGHALALGESPESQRFQLELEIRQRARKAFIDADNCSSLRRALLRRPRPVREDFEVEDWVLYWKRVGGNLRRSRGQWLGPAKIVAIDRRRVVWLVHGAKLVRASPEQLRPASLREWRSIQASGVTEVGKERLLQRARNRDFVDLDDEGIPESEERNAPETSETLDLPEPEREVSVNLPSNSSPEPVDGITVPVPTDEFSADETTDDLLFGDHLDLWSEMNGRAWEIDITPPNEQCFQGEWLWPDEVVMHATELRKKRVEVRLRDLGQDDQLRFAVAKDKELKAWLRHKTIERVAAGSIPQEALMRCRWLLSWKSPTGDEPSGDLNSQGKKAKARLVVIGYEDPDIETIANDSPTLTKDGRMAVLQQVASHRWELLSFDISTAFLHGKGDGRNLGLHPTPEMREALEMAPDDQCRLVGGAYGRIDAPYLWFCELRDELVHQGCQQCPLDPCVFGYYGRDSKGLLRLHGCLGMHVDDGIGGGDMEFMKMLKRVESRFKFGAFDRGEFTYTGIHFRQWDDGSIEYDQVGYFDKMQPIQVDKSRRAQSESPITEVERTRYRSLIGAMQYGAVHTRPDLAAKIGELQSKVKDATVEDMLVANRVLMEAKTHPVSLMVLPIDPSQVTFCAFSDASFSAAKQRAAHQGTLIFATTPEMLQNQRTVVAPIAWASKKVDRVVRSTLGAEAAAISNSVDRLMWIRILWAWLSNPECAWHQPGKVLSHENQGILVTDCKSAYDLLTRTAIPQCNEHRTTIDCLVVRERLKENCTVRWVASQAMLADCLTKTMDASVLRECLKTGSYSLQDESRLLKDRADKRQRLQWVRENGKKSSDPNAESALLHTARESKMHDFWKVDGSSVIRVHVVPRLSRYTPVGSCDCPVDLRELGPTRRTVTDMGVSAVDYWAANENHRSPMTQSWTGRTIFSRHSLESQKVLKS